MYSINLKYSQTEMSKQCRTGLDRLRKSKQLLSKKISNDQELIQSDPISCPQNLVYIVYVKMFFFFFFFLFFFCCCFFSQNNLLFYSIFKIWFRTTGRFMIWIWTTGRFLF